MAATLAESFSVPFHLGLTEPIDETTIIGDPAVEGAYDPVEQKWRLPDGMLLTDTAAGEVPFLPTVTVCNHGADDAQLD
jgi:hypothetical protein